MEKLKKLTKTLKALSDEGRARIVFLLSEKKNLCVNEIRELIGLSQPTISCHLKVLQNAGIVISEKDGQWVNYSINHYLGGNEKNLLEDILCLMKSSIKVKEDLKKLNRIERKVICDRD